MRETAGGHGHNVVSMAGNNHGTVTLPPG
jgi:hypothetical protein